MDNSFCIQDNIDRYFFKDCYSIFSLTLVAKVDIKSSDFLIKELKIHMLQGAPPVSEGSHTGALEV